MLSVLVLLVALQTSVWAQYQTFIDPFVPTTTSFTVTVSTLTTSKPYICYTIDAETEVTECRRKRGVEEKPDIIQSSQSVIAPSAVAMVEATPAPRDFRPKPDIILSSFDDSFTNAINVFRELSMKGRNNLIPARDCTQFIFDFAQFLACLGVSLQRTKLLTVTYTETETYFDGFSTMTVGGCTPSSFPFFPCSQFSTDVYGSSGFSSTTDRIVNEALIASSTVTPA